LTVQVLRAMQGLGIVHGMRRPNEAELRAKEMRFPHSRVFQTAVTVTGTGAALETKEFPMIFLEMDKNTPAALDNYWLWTCRRDSSLVLPPAYLRFYFTVSIDILSPLSRLTPENVRELIPVGPEGKIFVLQSVRFFGLQWEFVTVYFCFNKDGELVRIFSEDREKTQLIESCKSNVRNLEGMKNNTLELDVDTGKYKVNIEGRPYPITQERLNGILLKGFIKTLFALVQWRQFM
jgi:hypothetical protein